ncbi:MAG: hypothetical protein H0U51_05965 [Propionibacteriales bacterium]|nr:hypothetical protein [Propionibacteriales bacterium]
MGLTGVIYAAIVVAWAAYLVPLALRRHDEAARSRSIDRFSGAMRVLSRRGESTAGRLVVTPPRAIDWVISPGLSRRATAAVPVAAATPRPSRAALRAAATRRRRVLIVLACITAAVAAAAGFAVLPWWTPAFPLAFVAGFLCLVRHNVRLASDSYWMEAASASPTPSNVIRRTRVEASHGAAKGPDDEDTVPMDVEALRNAVTALEPERRVAVPLLTVDGGSLWDPLPITLPTYVDKPVAARTSRQIALGEPGTWSSGHSAEATKTAAASSRAAGEENTSTEDEPARVVNG